MPPCPPRIAVAVLAALAAPLAARAEVAPAAAREVATAQVSYDAAAHRYKLRAQGSYTVEYSLDLDDLEVVAGMLRITAALSGGGPVCAMTDAGTRYRDASDKVIEPEGIALSAKAQLLDHSLQGSEVVVRFREQPGAHVLEKTYRLRLEGLSLVVEISSGATWGLDGYAGVSLGHAESAAGARVVQLPYLPEPIALLPDGSVLSAFLDPTVSSAASIRRVLGPGPATALFAHPRSTAEPDTAGVSAPLFERAYLTLSPTLERVFPQVLGAASPYRSTVSDRLVLDDWGLHLAFGVPEGVAISWRSPSLGAVHAALRFADADAKCGDGVEVVLRQGGKLVGRRIVENGATTEQLWETDLTVAGGDEVRVEVLARGTNACDATTLRMTLATAADSVDTVKDFSGVQGQRGLSYLETVDGADTPMTWDAASARWKGQGAYSLIWSGGAHPGIGKTAYRSARNMVRRYREYGMTRLAILFHVWQRWGYDAGLPDHHPANPDLGTGAEMAAFVDEARAAGMLVALHENYTDMYPNAPPEHPSPLFDAGSIALARDGQKVLGWLNEGTKQQAYRIAAGSMQKYASQESPSIAKDYRPNATYLDVHTGWSPALALDHDAAKKAVPTLAHCHEKAVALFAGARGTYGGPLFGEGGEGIDRFDTYFAGAVDGVERQVEGRSRAAVAPDYELAAVKPRMLNHGMGYYGRYFVDEGQGDVALADADLDQYRASEIAFGHAGFLGDSLGGVRSWLRLHAAEYWLMQALQKRYADATVSRVLYDQQGQELDLEGALRAKRDLTTARIRVEHGDGLKVWVNRDSPARRTSSAGGFSHEQGQGGWSYLDGTTPMKWDPSTTLWRGAGPYALIGQYTMHPDGPPVVRAFTAPATASYHITGEVKDGDPSCGDGVLATVTHKGAVLWQCDLPQAVTCKLDLTQAASAGDVLSFQISQKTSNSCDSTNFSATLQWNDGAGHDWVVQTQDGPVTLPPSGFFAEDSQGFRAGTFRLPGSTGAVVDRVAGAAYTYARSRAGTLTSVGALQTDGAIAVVPGSVGLELHGTDLSEARLDGELLLRGSTRADVNLRFVDASSALLTVRDLAKGSTLDLAWSLPKGWASALAGKPDALTLRTADDQGKPQGDPQPLVVKDGAVMLSGLSVDQPYLITCPAARVGDAAASDG